MNSDGSGITRLTSMGVGDAFPNWSPDGTKIAFGANSDGAYEVYVINTDGNGLTNLTYSVANEDGRLTWSPDGTQIIFMSNRGGNNELYVMNADGSGVTRLTNNAADDEVPDWSP